MATKYKISSLQKLAQQRFAKALDDESWEISELRRSFVLLYNETESTTRLLREKVIIAASTHMPEVLEDQGFVELLMINGNIGTDILNSLFDPKSKPSTRQGSTSNPFAWIPRVRRGC